MHRTRTQHSAEGRLLMVVLLWGWGGGCATAGSAWAEADREVIIELAAEPSAVDIELMVSNGEPDQENLYPSTVLVESDAAPGFRGGPGFAGVCSGVLLAKDLVLTAAHCMCAQPIYSSLNKTLNRADCATRAVVKQYVPTIERSKNGSIKRTITDYPEAEGEVFLPDAFRVDLDAQGQISSIRADLAIIRLKSEINIPLDHEPAEREFRPGDRITVVGFGGTSPGSKKASRIRSFGKNTVTGTRVMEYVARPSNSQQHAEAHFHREYEANTESGDSGGPCFREEGKRRWLMGIMLHKMNATGVKTSCLDLFQSKPLLEKLIHQARAQTD